MREYWNAGFSRRHLRIPDADPAVEAAADRAAQFDEGITESLRPAPEGEDTRTNKAWSLAKSKRRGYFNSRFDRHGAKAA